MRPAIVRIVRKTGGWCFPGLHFQVEVFFPVGTESWERSSHGYWSGRTAREAVDNFRTGNKRR